MANRRSTADKCYPVRVVVFLSLFSFTKHFPRPLSRTSGTLEYVWAVLHNHRNEQPSSFLLYRIASKDQNSTPRSQAAKVQKDQG